MDKNAEIREARLGSPGVDVDVVVDGRVGTVQLTPAEAWQWGQTLLRLGLRAGHRP